MTVENGGRVASYRFFKTLGRVASYRLLEELHHIDSLGFRV